MKFRVLGLAAAVALVVSGASAEKAGALAEKLVELQERYEKGSTEPKDFDVEEKEANEFLRQQEGLPAGVESPWIRFEDQLAVVGATVDMEKFRESLPDSMILRLLTGRVPVEITARVRGEKGVGKLDLERILLAGVELPESLVALLAEGEGASGFLPPGFQLGKPFALPYDLESIRCRLGGLRLRQRPTVHSK